MPVNHVICCDGTNNQFGTENTNVVRLVQVLDRDPERQRVYYDPGVGTMPEPGVRSKVGQWLSTVYGLAFGAGLSGNVTEAYTYLMNHWEEGDQVFLFGFSRGAYTVRVLAGMLYAVGLMPKGNENMVPYALRIHRAVRREERRAERASGDGSSWGKKGPWHDLCDDFRETFARPVFRGDKERHFGVAFAGLWDTVSSVGWVWNPMRYPYTAWNPKVAALRHAVSLDERRCFFRQNMMSRPDPVDGEVPEQMWFPGVHCDVGGGYPVGKSGLWREPFRWVLEGAKGAGLLVDDQRLERVMNGWPASEKPWCDEAHESLTWHWWAAEVFPKVYGRKVRFGLWRRRNLSSGAVLHESTLRRIRDGVLVQCVDGKVKTVEYSPTNLPQAFLKEVRSLQDIPKYLRYAGNGQVSRRRG